MSMGMVMLPAVDDLPPFKIMVFVLVDGWDFSSGHWCEVSISKCEVKL